MPQADRMIDVEERGLEVGLDAVRDEQALDHPDQRVLPSRLPLVPGKPVHVAERADELRERDRVDGALLKRDRVAEVAASRLDLRERVEAVHVAGEAGESRAVERAGGAESPRRPVDLAELHGGPRGCFGLAGGSVERESHRLDCAGDVAEQLARVPDSRIRGEARLQRPHSVERRECLAVAAELDEGIADDAVVAGRRGRDRVSTAYEGERVAKGGT